MLSVDDEREIAAVITRYATAIDTRDWASFRTCFTEDVSAEYGSFGTWNRLDDMTTFMEAAHAALGPTLHRLSNIVVSGEAGRARARTYVDAILMPLQVGGTFHQAMGYYDDEVLRTANGWKILRRRFTAVHIV